MIDINKLTEKDVGRWVIYTGGDGHKERGKIKSWNADWNLIYTVYNTAGNWGSDLWLNYTAAGTHPEDLEFE